MHSGYPVPEFKQRRPPAPELHADKVYLTWLMSDGDNLPVLSRANFPKLWRDQARGRVPIAWSFSPCVALMLPAVADYYFRTATDTRPNCPRSMRFSPTTETVSASELAGTVSETFALRFADRFEAEGLSHRSGLEQADCGVPSGKVWAAKTGESEAGHIVFGPYKPLPAGRYLALFRMKRTGDGNGGLARIDVHADGAASDAAACSIAVSDAPLDAWRSYPLEFRHAGGAVETRVFWPGQASLAVDEILLWEIVP